MKNKSVITFFLVFSLLITAFATSGCEKDSKKQMIYTEYFDTVTVFTAYTDKNVFSEMCSIISDTLKNYHELLDIYNTYDGRNNLKTINDVAPQSTKVDKELFNFLEWSKEAYYITDGQTNIAMGSVTSLWHDARLSFVEGGTTTLPTQEALQKANEYTSIESLKLDEKNLCVSIDIKGTLLDAGALAKGYVTDQIYLKLTERGYSNFIINIGGNVKAHGQKNEKDQWLVAIEDPENTKKTLCSLQLSNESLVTSGSYQRYFELDGIRYHHIIDPKTLMPQNTFLSVSVICESSALADALSTALFNMSYEEGLSLVNRLGSVDILWVFNDGSQTLKYTDGFSVFFED